MRPTELTPSARGAMSLPASLGLIFFSFVVAYLLSVLPWSGTWLLARPDFILLVLMFWSLHEPRAIGQGMAFTLGATMATTKARLAEVGGFEALIDYCADDFELGQRIAGWRSSGRSTRRGCFAGT